MWSTLRARLLSSIPAIKHLGPLQVSVFNFKNRLLPSSNVTSIQNASFVNFAQSLRCPTANVPKLLHAGVCEQMPTFSPQLTLTRSLTKFSLKKGKRKTVKAVIKRFYRLNWGAWIRTRAGRSKRLFFKSAARKRRLRQHVFTNATQSWLLDKMVTNFWRKRKYYVDDPYEPYHTREEFPFTRKKPFIPRAD